VLITSYGHVNTCGALVSRKPNVRNRDHRQPRVFQFVADNLSNLFPQSVGCSLCSTHRPSAPLQLSGRDSLDDVSLNLVADFQVVEVFQTDTTLEALADLGHVILEPPQRSDVAFPAHYA